MVSKAFTALSALNSGGVKLFSKLPYVASPILKFAGYKNLASCIAKSGNVTLSKLIELARISLKLLWEQSFDLQLKAMPQTSLNVVVAGCL